MNEIWVYRMFAHSLGAAWYLECAWSYRCRRRGPLRIGRMTLWIADDNRSYCTVYCDRSYVGYMSERDIWASRKVL